MGTTGLLSPSISAPLKLRCLCLARDVLARYSGLADFAFAMQGLGSGPISLYGTDTQRTRYLSRVEQGEAIPAFALTEPASGSDVAAIATTARVEGDEVVIEGEKTWISNGGIADFYVVFARTGEAPGAKGLSAFIVDADAPGLRIAERLHVIAPHPLARLTFDNCRVPLANRIGDPGRGFAIAMGTLDLFRSTVGAAALGFGPRRAPGDRGARQHPRALRRADGDRCRWRRRRSRRWRPASTRRRFWSIAPPTPMDMGAERVTREASMAKLFATEMAQEVVDRAVQLHGGDGVRSGTKVEELYREVRALRIYEGASEVQKIIIARQVLAASRPPEAVRRAAAE